MPVDCAGFYGNKNLGNRVAGDARFRDLQGMHRTEASMCSKAMLSVARGIRERWGTPFFEGSFYGLADTSQALRDFASVLGDPDLTARTETLIAREEAATEAALAPYRRRLAGKRLLTFSGGFKSWSVISAMQDVGMSVVATGTEKSTEEDKARIYALMGPDARLIDDNDQTALLQAFERYDADILAAGDRYIYPALKARVPFLDLDHVRDIGYAGYAGIVEFARQVVVSVESPVWAKMRARPRWAAGGKPSVSAAIGAGA